MYHQLKSICNDGDAQEGAVNESYQYRILYSVDLEVLGERRETHTPEKGAVRLLLSHTHARHILT